jgi:predicted amidohydrolase YtcJ
LGYFKIQEMNSTKEPEDKILKTQVAMTVMGGKVVFKK